MKQESRYESEDETRRKCILLAGFIMGKGMLKYANDPVGMYRDQDFNVFTDPFIKYLNHEITFVEAKNELNLLGTQFQNEWVNDFHWFILEMFYETKTGRSFREDYRLLKRGDEKSKEVAINLTKVFKPAFRKNENIQELLKKAAIEGDEFFLQAILNSRFSETPDIKRNYYNLLFVRLNEERIQNLSRKEIVELARKQRINFSDEDSLLRYIRRAGIMKKSGRPRRAVEEKPDDSIKAKLAQHAGEFEKYLFDLDSKDTIKGYLNEIRKLIKSHK